MVGGVVITSRVGVGTCQSANSQRHPQSFTIKPNEKFVTIWMRFLAFFGHSESKAFITSTKPINVTSVKTFDAENGIQEHTEAKTITAAMRVLKFTNSEGKEVVCRQPQSRFKDKLDSFISNHLYGTVDVYFEQDLVEVVNHVPGASVKDLKILYQFLQNRPGSKNLTAVKNFNAYLEKTTKAKDVFLQWTFTHPASRYSRQFTEKIKIESGTSLLNIIKKMIDIENSKHLPRTSSKSRPSGTSGKIFGVTCM
jgi:hypothetical protein